MEPSEKPPVAPQRVHGNLHIYSQEGNHCDAWICGSREALTDLRDAINRALESPEPSTADGFHAYAADGEGYAIFIVPMEEPVFKTLGLPYSLEWMERGAHPFSLVDRERYRTIARDGR